MTNRLLLFELLLLMTLSQAVFCDIRVKVSAKDSLNVEESGESLGAKFRLKREPISILCEFPADPGLKLKWNVAEEDETKYEISETEEKKLEGNKVLYKGVLTIRDPTEKDIVDYKCSAIGVENGKPVEMETSQGPVKYDSVPLVTMLVNSKPTKDFTPSSGESVEIQCQVKPQFDSPRVQWFRVTDSGNSLPLNNSKAFKVEGDKVTVQTDSLDYETDRGVLMCRATSDKDVNEYRLFLRVKNPSAFLIPLVTIIVEVCVILVIVAAYEIARRKKRAADADSTDANKTD